MDQAKTYLLKFDLFRTTLIALLIQITFSGLGQSQEADSSKSLIRIPEKSKLISSYNLSHFAGSFGTGAKELKGMPFEDIKVSGVFRFVSIYRNMSRSYEDMQTSDRNISFLDYPLTDISSSGGIGNPMMALALTSKVNRTASFRISYSIAHSFTGSADNDVNKMFTSNGGLAFEGNYVTRPVKMNLKFGGLLTLRVSRLVFDAPKYRDSFFDRIMTNSQVSKQESVFAKDEDGRRFLWPYVRGGIARFTFPNLKNAQLLTMYGRTGQTISGIDIIDEYPAINYLVRAQTPYRFRKLSGQFALNYYKRDADTDKYSGISDDLTQYSTDFKLIPFRGLELKTDLAYSLIDNPLIENPVWGNALVLHANTAKTLTKIPLSLEYYNVSHNYGNLDGEVLNSNVALRSGGVNGDPTRDQSQFVNVGQEVGLIANNRAGISLTAKTTIKDLKLELGYANSREKENLYDSITFQHRVNAFSRSRFWQWRQGIGPYGRIKSVYARTFEVLTISDELNGIGTDYRKGFTNVELLAKYQFDLAGRNLTLINFANAQSIQDRIALVPTSNDVFVFSWYEDITAMYRVAKKWMLIGNMGYERIKGGVRVDLSPDKLVDDNGDAYSDEDRTVNQVGRTIGLGFGYDITTKMSLQMRHKWMDHVDDNFTQDVFRGQETTVELKMTL